MRNHLLTTRPASPLPDPNVAEPAPVAQPAGLAWRLALALGAALVVTLTSGCTLARSDASDAIVDGAGATNQTTAEPAHAATSSTIKWTGVVIDPAFYDRAALDIILERASDQGHRLTIVDASTPTKPLLDFDLAGTGSNNLFAGVDAEARLDSARHELIGYGPAGSSRDIFGALTVLADLGHPARAGEACTVIIIGDGHNGDGDGPSTASLDPADPESARRFVSDLALRRLVPDLSLCSLTVTGLTSAGNEDGAVLVELWESYAERAAAQLVPVGALP